MVVVRTLVVLLVIGGDAAGSAFGTAVATIVDAFTASMLLSAFFFFGCDFTVTGGSAFVVSSAGADVFATGCFDVAISVTRPSPMRERRTAASRMRKSRVSRDG